MTNFLQVSVTLRTAFLTLRLPPSFPLETAKSLPKKSRRGTIVTQTARCIRGKLWGMRGAVACSHLRRIRCCVGGGMPMTIHERVRALLRPYLTNSSPADRTVHLRVQKKQDMPAVLESAPDPQFITTLKCAPTDYDEALLYTK